MSVVTRGKPQHGRVFVAEFGAGEADAAIKAIEQFAVAVVAHH
jgi:hypothetical protein